MNLLCQYETNLGGVSLQSQISLCFVDDLKIAYPDKNVYHQIKDVKDLTWKSGSSLPLWFDFLAQIVLCKLKKESFHLKLVHSNTNANLNKIPKGAKKHTTVEYFPVQPSMNSLVNSDTAFQDELKLLLYNGASLPVDVLSDLASSLLGIWVGADSSKSVSLQSIDSGISRFFPGYRSTVTTTMTPEFRSIIERMVGADYSVQGDTLFIKYNNASISFPWGEDIQNKIVQSNPSSPLDLFKMDL